MQTDINVQMKVDKNWKRSLIQHTSVADSSGECIGQHMCNMDLFLF